METTERQRVESQDDIENMLLNSLPSGSGINGDWEFEFKNRSKRICMSNSFHCTDESGSYVGWADFTAIIDYEDEDYFRLVFHGGKSRRLALKYGLRDFLTDTLCESLYYNFHIFTS